MDLIDLAFSRADALAGTWKANAAASVLLAAAVALLRWFLARRVRAADISQPELRRRWLVQVRNGCFLLLLFGLVAIWSAELERLAISLLAIIVAIVLATKELILCLTGSLLKMRSGAFSIGDRIEVNGLRGDVVDQTLLTTRLAEVGSGNGAPQYTGRAITLPNSLFLTCSVANDSELDGFVLHTLTVPVARTADWAAAEAALLQAARQACAGYIDEARAHVERHARDHGLEATEVDPRVSLSVPDPARVDLTLRVAAPARQARRVGQEILRAWLAQTAPAAPPPP